MVYIRHLRSGRDIWSRLNFDKTFIVFISAVINERLFNCKITRDLLWKLKFDGSSIKSFVVHRVNMRCARTAVTQSLKHFGRA